MPAALLDSQLAALEPPGPDERAVRVDVTRPLAAQIEEIVSTLTRDSARRAGDRFRVRLDQVGGPGVDGSVDTGVDGSVDTGSWIIESGDVAGLGSWSLDPATSGHSDSGDVGSLDAGCRILDSGEVESLDPGRGSSSPATSGHWTGLVGSRLRRVGHGPGLVDHSSPSTSGTGPSSSDQDPARSSQSTPGWSGQSRPGWSDRRWRLPDVGVPVGSCRGMRIDRNLAADRS